MANPFADAVALIYANRRHDESGVRRVLEDADLPDLALVLAQMVQTAVLTRGMTVEAFLDMQMDQIVEHEQESGMG
jgi:hypothetical protein